MTETQLRRLVNNVYAASDKLISALSKLSQAASTVLGYEVVADICAGKEIEFRKVDESGVAVWDDCIRIEEIISKL